jgi:O-antigen ligase
MQEIYAQLELWLYRLLFVSFFLPAKFQTLFLILYCVWIAINAIQRKVFLNKTDILTALLLGGGYLFYMAYIPLTPSESMPVLQSYLERKISILLLPFMVPLIYKLLSKSLFSELYWFAISNCLHGILVNAILFSQMLQPNESLRNHVAYRLNFENITGIHPTYYGMFICFSLAIILFDKYVEKMRSMYRIVGQMLLLLLLLLLTPKISMLLFLVIYFYYFFFILSIRPLQKMLLLAGITVALIASYFVFPYFHDRIAEVFTFISKSDGNAAENSLHFRNLIYQIDFNILKDSWLFGIGPVKLQEYLDMAYFNLSVITKQMIVSYNTHNEYLNQWICFGLAGLLYFISVFVLHIKKAHLQKNLLYYAFLLVVMVSCMTENILSRQSGIIFFAFFGALFYYSNQLSLVEENK